MRGLLDALKAVAVPSGPARGAKQQPVLELAEGFEGQEVIHQVKDRPVPEQVPHGRNPSGVPLLEQRASISSHAIQLMSRRPTGRFSIALFTSLGRMCASVQAIPWPAW